MGATRYSRILNNAKFKEGRGNYLDNKQIGSTQWEFKFLNVVFYVGFPQKVQVRQFDLWHVFNKGLYGLQFC